MDRSYKSRTVTRARLFSGTFPRSSTFASILRPFRTAMMLQRYIHSIGQRVASSTSKRESEYNMSRILWLVKLNTSFRRLCSLQCTNFEEELEQVPEDGKYFLLSEYCPQCYSSAKQRVTHKAPSRLAARRRSTR
jgi:hypothetical protein